MSSFAAMLLSSACYDSKKQDAFVQGGIDYDLLKADNGLLPATFQQTRKHIYQRALTNHVWVLLNGPAIATVAVEWC